MINFGGFGLTESQSCVLHRKASWSLPHWHVLPCCHVISYSSHNSGQLRLSVFDCSYDYLYMKYYYYCLTYFIVFARLVSNYFVWEGALQSSVGRPLLSSSSISPSPTISAENLTTSTTPSANQSLPSVGTTPSSSHDPANPFSSLEAFKTFLAGHVKTRKPFEHI